MQNPIVILGATSSIARAVAGQFAAQKRDLIIAGRNTDELHKTAADLRIRHNVAVEVLTFEAGDFASHQNFFAKCLEQGGGNVGGVVLCHGYMANQNDAQQNFAQTQRMIDINYTSAVSVLNLFANHFEEKREGFLCAVSSVAGDRGRQSNYLYGSTKAALNTYLAGLRVRMAKVKVPVITVKPGFVDTRMTWGLPGMFLVATPQQVGKDICRAVGKGRDEIYTPWFWWGIMSIICNIPNLVFKRMKM